MRKIMCIFTVLFFLECDIPSLSSALEYSWMKSYDPSQTIALRIPVPKGYERIPVPPGSFQHWLRHLPLKTEDAEVLLFNGENKSRQDVHVAVIDLDVGLRDLQQCADAVMRLWAEYLYARKQYEAIHFNFTSGDRASFQQWSLGDRPKVKGNNVRWQKSKAPSNSYSTFRAYLDTVFMYAGSSSLEQELVAVKTLDDMQIGDVFIQGGFPGHAVIVVDMARQQKSRKKLFMLAQSYMPAQDVHILKNPEKWHSTPWYEDDSGTKLRTPEWTFQKENLKRFSKP